MKYLLHNRMCQRVADDSELIKPETEQVNAKYWFATLGWDVKLKAREHYDDMSKWLPDITEAEIKDFQDYIDGVPEDSWKAAEQLVKPKKKAATKTAKTQK